MSASPLFADVILPLAAPNLYTYSVPDAIREQVRPGLRVVVSFGPKKYYTAIIKTIHSNEPKSYVAKPIKEALDNVPLVNELQFKLWDWVAEYYMCTPGEVLMAALPSGLKLASEEKIALNSDFSDLENLDESETLLVKTLAKKESLTITEIEKRIPGTSAHRLVKSLIDLGAVTVYEELKRKYKPKNEDFVRLAQKAIDSQWLRKHFDDLEKRAFKQLQVLMEVVRIAGLENEAPPPYPGVSKTVLARKVNADSQILKALEKKGLIEIYSVEEGRLEKPEKPSMPASQLTTDQKNAMKQIREDWQSKDVSLLHGVTSSGKTEVYVHLIEAMLKAGKQVLYLLPEIALTTQVVSRIRKVFGDQLGVYHSKFNENERVEIYQAVNEFKGETGSRYSLILGARSALFLPFSNLGLILVDEEHDASFKQMDPAPRYHARDTALVLARIHKAKVLLGSATPSMESQYQAHEGKYGYTKMQSRFGGIEMPEIRIVDLQNATRKKKMKSIFSGELLEEIKYSLERNEQVILFQNRRGFAPQLECRDCRHHPSCKNCDVSLVYHKASNRMQCHYCGYSTDVPRSCEACGSQEMQMKNFGTERVEEELEIFFSDAGIARMDYDSTRSKYAHEQIISDFEQRKTNILIGTQMVTKGLDFNNVGLVGVLSADQLLHFPDFRAHERSFQMLAQVAGRAGRKGKRGKVLIQTFTPDHPVIHMVKNNEFDQMYHTELAHRKEFNYPPFCRVVELNLSDRDPEVVYAASIELKEELQSQFGDRVLGPVDPLVPRIRNRYHKKILLKFGRNESVHKAKLSIHKLLGKFKIEKGFKQFRVQIDVDPA